MMQYGEIYRISSVLVSAARNATVGQKRCILLGSFCLANIQTTYSHAGGVGAKKLAFLLRSFFQSVVYSDFGAARCSKRGGVAV